MHLHQTAHNKAELCFCKMSVLVHKAETAPTKLIADFEKSLGRVLSKEFNVVAERAVKKAMNAFAGKASKAEVNRVMAAIDKEMNKFGSDNLEKTVEKAIAIFYVEVTTRFIKQFNLRVQKAARPPGQVSVDFGLVDEDAVAAVQRLTVQTAGKYYPEQLKTKTSEVVAEVILEKGLPPKEAAIRLESEIRGALGVQEAASVVPARFATNPQAYFQIVASNASVTSTSLGRVISMSDAGVEKWKVSAIIDSRTSQICRSLDGKEFSVGGTMKGVERFLEVQNFDELQGDFGFTADGSVPKWADSGLGFPPYHHSCRTTVVPVF